MYRLTHFALKLGILGALTASGAIAWGGGESSGGGLIVQQAAFNKLSAEEALTSSKFDKKLPNIYFNEWKGVFKASESICIENDETLRTAYRQLDCPRWKVDLHWADYTKKFETFHTEASAQQVSDENTFNSEPYCPNPSYKYKYLPLEQVIEDCAFWRVDRKKGAPKVFFYENLAKQYAKESKHADGEPYCRDADVENVLKVTPDEYRVEFFAKPKKLNAERRIEKLKVGSHRYPYPSCNQFPSLRPDGADAEVQMAGGESSGGGLNKTRSL